MILPFLLAALPQAAGPAIAPDDRYAACLAQAQSDPVAAEREAARWQAAGGGFRAQQCAGIALADQERWAAAAAAFEEAAHGAQVSRDTRAASTWAQAGNAWLAAGEPGKARAALDTALAAGTLQDQARGEAQLDRARAEVAASDLPAARADLDAALANAPDDPLAWLLSATLARRMDDLPRARTDIAEALQRSPDDPSVQLEAGNDAALAGDEAGAKAAWRQVVRLRPGSPQAKSAAVALAQFGPEPAAASGR